MSFSLHHGCGVDRAGRRVLGVDTAAGPNFDVPAHGVIAVASILAGVAAFVRAKRALSLVGAVDQRGPNDVLVRRVQLHLPGAVRVDDLMREHRNFLANPNAVDGRILDPPHADVTTILVEIPDDAPEPRLRGATGDDEHHQAQSDETSMSPHLFLRCC